ncbi:MAG: hypothetical protein IPM97_07485 [Bdellovibrionaceae bacterium]|nr:hypothetical protein [Pseudobdellovibrionaceae bacterium]
MKNNCFCAFCRTPRRIYKRRNIGLINISYAALASVLVMYLIWKSFDPRVLMVFAVFLALTEVFIQLRWRMSVPCRQCGFDPVLYIKDQERAVEKVTLHLKSRKENPNNLLAKPLNLPSISREKSEALQNKEKRGTLVSRQI